MPQPSAAFFLHPGCTTHTIMARSEQNEVLDGSALRAITYLTTMLYKLNIVHY